MWIISLLDLPRDGFITLLASICSWCMLRAHNELYIIYGSLYWI